MLKKLLFALLTILFSSTWANAQCAMCKAVVESNEAGNSLATGLNLGILYLMIFPYLLMGGVAFAIYKSRQKKVVNTD